MIEDDNLEALYHKFWDMNGKLIAEGFHPLEIAGILVAQALAIYKTVLPEDDFEEMMDRISESREHVKKINMDTLQ